jgi:hypothetical protein
VNECTGGDSPPFDLSRACRAAENLAEGVYNRKYLSWVLGWELTHSHRVAVIFIDRDKFGADQQAARPTQGERDSARGGSGSPKARRLAGMGVATSS